MVTTSTSSKPATQAEFLRAFDANQRRVRELSRRLSERDFPSGSVSHVTDSYVRDVSFLLSQVEYWRSAYADMRQRWLDTGADEHDAADATLAR
jgi:hypothetical protein